MVHSTRPSHRSLPFCFRHFLLSSHFCFCIFHLIPFCLPSHSCFFYLLLLSFFFFLPSTFFFSLCLLCSTIYFHTCTALFVFLARFLRLLSSRFSPFLVSFIHTGCLSPLVPVITFLIIYQLLHPHNLYLPPAAPLLLTRLSSPSSFPAITY